MNRRHFLGQVLKVLALSPILFTDRAIKAIAKPTIADNIRLERPPSLEEEPYSPGINLYAYPRSISLGADNGEWFTVNFDVRDGILYLWQ